MIKKAICALSAIAIVPFSCGCGNGAESSADDKKDTEITTAASTTDATEETAEKEIEYELNRIESVNDISFLVSDKWICSESDGNKYFNCYDDDGDMIGMIGACYVGDFAGTTDRQKEDTLEKIVESNEEIDGATNVKRKMFFTTAKFWAAKTDYNIYSSLIGGDTDAHCYSFFYGDSLYMFSYYDKSGKNDIHKLFTNMAESIT